MKSYTLDLTSFTEAKPLQSYLMNELDFPFYYGKNLDALYDELSTLTEEACFHLILPADPAGGMADYLPRLVQVFEDATEHSDKLWLEIEKR